VIEINSQNSIAWVCKGTALNDLNKFGEALKACDKAIKISQQFSMVE
jgi:hypothetical protein